MTDIQNNITVSAGRKLCGSIGVISSKSELHRLIFCACLADGKTVITYNSSLSKDIIATVSCFRALGAEISVMQEQKTITVEKPLDLEYAGNSLAPDTEIFCCESGSTARFLLPLISVICRRGAVMTGEGKLPQRPFSDLCRCLSAKGAKFSAETMPIRIENTAIPEGDFEISGNISSQYLSGLLFILPLCKNGRIKLTTPLESSGYVDMTMEAMAKFGVKVSVNNGIYTCSGKYASPDGVMPAGGDWSNAAFFLCAANSKEITVTDIDPCSLQPDKAVADILSDCGITTEYGKNSISVTRGENTRPFEIDAGETPDLVPVLSVLAASLCGRSTIKNIRRLRFKESDRVDAVCKMITCLGGSAFADENNIYIDGNGSLDGGCVDSFNDHRIAMSAAIAASICKNDVTILGADAVKKSYPDFFEILSSLTEGGK